MTQHTLEIILSALVVLGPLGIALEQIPVPAVQLIGRILAGIGAIDFKTILGKREVTK